MKPPNTRPGDSQQARRTVTLRRDKVEAFRAMCRQRGHVGSTLIYSWVWDAARRAQLGLALPAAGSEPSGEGRRLGMLWSQEQGEYDRWVSLIEARGSSLRDVIGARVARYVESGGDTLAVAEGWGEGELPLSA